jgi:hypothetical protein
MYLHQAIVTNHDKLVAAFDQMKPPGAHFGQESIASDLMFDISDRAAHDTATQNRFCAKNGRAPVRIGNGWRRQLLTARFA